MSALLTTALSLPNRRQGKVRDLYDVTLPNGDEGLLSVATDRVSVFDVVLENGIPGKGIMLTTLSSFWFDHFSEQFKHHLVSTDVNDVPGLTEIERDLLRGRIMLCRKARVLPVECIVRGYLTGSGLKDYEQSGMVCGIPLRAGLSNSDPLDEPIFTPSTKADSGHDENISYEEACRIVGESEMAQVRATAMQIYGEGRRYALERGVIIADTKFEFGILPGEQAPILIDEVLTPDSSRFWPAADWRSGTEQDSFDKQFVRNFTESLVAQGLWNKEAPGPALPDDVIHQTQARYQEAIDRLMG